MGEISSRGGDAVSDIKKLKRGGGYVSEEFRPPEEVEEEAREKGPEDYVPIEEVPAKNSDPLELLIQKERAEKRVRREARREEVADAQAAVKAERVARRQAEKTAGWKPLSREKGLKLWLARQKQRGAEFSAQVKKEQAELERQRAERQKLRQKTKRSKAA